MESYKIDHIETKKNNLIDSIKNAVLLLYVVVETIYKTIFGMYFLVLLERLQCVAGVALVAILVVLFFRLDNTNKKKWIRKHWLVFIYFVVRMATFVYSGMEYSMLRSLLFEVIYLLALTELIVDNDFCKKVIMKFFIGFNLALNVVDVFVYLYCKYISTTSVFFIFIEKYTYIDSATEAFNSCMYSNSNQIGLMTGIAMLIMLNYLSKNLPPAKKVLAVLYYIFSIYCLFISECASSYVAMFAVVVAYILVKYVKFITGKRIIVVCLAGCILASTSFYIFAASNEENGYNNLELKADVISSYRYSIWKDCYYSHQEELLLGCGNMTLEKRDRYQYKIDHGKDYYGYDVNGSLVNFFGPHNGYIGVLSCTGLIGLIAFILVLLNKIKGAKLLNGSYMYLAIVFILVINIFECMMPISKNFCSLYMFLILAMGNDNGDKAMLLELEETE